MAVASWGGPACGFVFPANAGIAIAFAVAGAVTVILGVLSFRRARTTVNPMKPGSASSLVCSGVYTWTRNPMYLGLLVALTGWGAFLSNALALLFLPAFILYMNRFQIEPEERALTTLFGQEFIDYKSQVRRWL
jgi:protein-S-isoprenylcysteine O-methyltransferase Ste14